MEKNRVFYGVSVSRGLAMGRAFICDVAGPREERLSTEEAKRQALAVLDEAVWEMRESARLLPVELKRLTEAQIALLEDRGLREAVEKGVDEGLSPGQSIARAMEEIACRLEESPSDYMRERAKEMRGLAREAQRRLRGKRAVPEGAVFISQDITVPEALALVRSKVAAVVLEEGAVTSHGAIVLRDYEIPMVIELYEATRLVPEGALVAVDGSQGMVVVEPDGDFCSDFQKKMEAEARVKAEMEKLIGIPPVTRNGHRVSVMMNLDMPEETALVEKVGGCGVGLFRTEYLYLAGIRDEETQFRVYKKMAEAVAPYPFTIRTFDMGGDKVMGLPEANPFLGLRGIRFLLSRPDLFKQQLRAAVRSNTKGNVRIMFPMVSSLEEFWGAADLFREVVEEVRPDHIPQLGIMVEVPSAVILADEFAKEVDFMSIGTNDLTQYTLAVDRQNFRVSHLYQQMDPSVLRSVAMVVEAGKRAQIPVAVCGELASDPTGALVLLSLGVKELSVAPPSYLRTKKIVLDMDIGAMDILRDSILSARTPEQVKRLARWVIKQKSDKIPH